ncbi:hypothetical protein FG877_00095 [Enterococcus casseliflavus]|nr:hypothetical protein [Enterococcus casseliflavus]
MKLTKKKLILKYTNYAIKSSSFSEARVRTFLEKEDFSPFYIYKYFESFDNLKRKSAECFVHQNLINDYVNFDDTSLPKLVTETVKYFGKHEYRDILFFDEYCGRIVMNEYYIPTLKKIFKTLPENEIAFQYATIVGILINKREQLPVLYFN